ncbi:hypothetical protein FBU30_006046, partial [Linnemannia zychae]
MIQNPTHESSSVPASSTFASSSTASSSAFASSSSTAAVSSLPNTSKTDHASSISTYTLAGPSRPSKPKRTYKSTAKSKARLNRDELVIILSWLEQPANFGSVFGVQSTIIGQVKKPWKALEPLADVINKSNKNRLNLTGKGLKDRIDRHRQLYKKWKTISNSTGFGITEEDRLKGIFSITDKLEKNCMCFERMDRLFGERPDVAPLYEIDATNGPVSFNASSDSDGDDTEDDSESAFSNNNNESNVEEHAGSQLIVTYKRRRRIIDDEEEEEEEEEVEGEKEMERVEEWVDDLEWNLDGVNNDISLDSIEAPRPINVDDIASSGTIKVSRQSLSTILEEQTAISSSRQSEANANRRTAKKKRKENTGAPTCKAPLSLSSSQSQKSSSIVNVIAESSLKKLE